ncbi:MAG: 50S ribosomal protein L1 [Acidimicrobiia bacterium]
MGKRYRDAAAGFDKAAAYSPREALELVKALAFAKFDETVEAAFALGIDPRQAEQAVRGTVSLPNGTGKEVRVAVFAQGEQLRQAEAAGADVVGGKDLAEHIAGGGDLDFDVAIAVPDMMGEVGKLGRILGPRGLMPNPKAGTVTTDVGKTVAEFKAGKMEYRNDRYGNVHVAVGKASFEVGALEQNLAAVVDELIRARPAAAKGRYLRKLTVVKVDVNRLEDLLALVR